MKPIEVGDRVEDAEPTKWGIGTVVAVTDYHPSPLVVEWHSHHGISRRKANQVRRISPQDGLPGQTPDEYSAAFRSVSILFRHAVPSLGLEASYKHAQFLQDFLQEQLEAHHD